MTNNNGKKRSKVPRIFEAGATPFCPNTDCEYSREHGGILGSHEELREHYIQSHPPTPNDQGRFDCVYAVLHQCQTFATMQPLLEHLSRHWDVKGYPCPYQENSSEYYDPKDLSSRQCPFTAYDRSHLKKHTKREHSAEKDSKGGKGGNAAASTSRAANTQGTATFSTAIYDAPTPGLTDAPTPASSAMPTTPRELDDADDGPLARPVTDPVTQASTSTARAHVSSQAYPQVPAPPANAPLLPGNPSFTRNPAQAWINEQVSARVQREVQAEVRARVDDAFRWAAEHGVSPESVLEDFAYASAQASPRPPALRTSRAPRFAPYPSPHTRPRSLAVQVPIAQPFEPARRASSVPAANLAYNGPDPFAGAANTSSVPAQQAVQDAPGQYDPAHYAQAPLAPANHAPAYAPNANGVPAQQADQCAPAQDDPAQYAQAQFAPANHTPAYATHANGVPAQQPVQNAPDQYDPAQYAQAELAAADYASAYAANANDVPPQQPAQNAPAHFGFAQYDQADLAPAEHAPMYATQAPAAVAQEFTAGYPNAWNVTAGAGYQPDVASYAAPTATATFTAESYPAITVTHAAPVQPPAAPYIQHAPAYAQLAPAYDDPLDAQPWLQAPLPHAPALSPEDLAKQLAAQQDYMRHNAPQPLPHAESAPVLPPPMQPSSMQPVLQAADYAYAPLGGGAVARRLAAEYRGGDDGRAGYRQQAPDEFGGYDVHPAAFQ